MVTSVGLRMLRSAQRCGLETRKGQDAEPASRSAPRINPIHFSTGLLGGRSENLLWREALLSGPMILWVTGSRDPRRSGGLIWKMWTEYSGFQPGAGGNGGEK